MKSIFSNLAIWAIMLVILSLFSLLFFNRFIVPAIPIIVGIMVFINQNTKNTYQEKANFNQPIIRRFCKNWRKNKCIKSYWNTIFQRSYPIWPGIYLLFRCWRFHYYVYFIWLNLSFTEFSASGSPFLFALRLLLWWTSKDWMGFLKNKNTMN